MRRNATVDLVMFYIVHSVGLDEFWSLYAHESSLISPSKFSIAFIETYWSICRNERLIRATSTRLALATAPVRHHTQPGHLGVARRGGRGVLFRLRRDFFHCCKQAHIPTKVVGIATSTDRIAKTSCKESAMFVNG